MKEKNTAPRPDTIPIYVFDEMTVRNSHREKIHWILHVIELVVIVAIVAGFLIYLNQYEYVSNESITVDGQDGVANYIGKDGNIYNGEDNGTADAGAIEEESALSGNHET